MLSPPQYQEVNIRIANFKQQLKEVGPDHMQLVMELDNLRLPALPASIRELTNLRALFLYENKLTALPAEMGSLKHLEKLMLQQNCLNALPAELANCTRLQILDLRHNKLEGAIPDVIYSVTSLKQLLLTYNKITELSEKLGKLKVEIVFICNISVC